MFLHSQQYTFNSLHYKYKYDCKALLQIIPRMLLLPCQVFMHVICLTGFIFQCLVHCPSSYHISAATREKLIHLHHFDYQSYSLLYELTFFDAGGSHISTKMKIERTSNHELFCTQSRFRFNAAFTHFFKIPSFCVR
jgi:hypothetical protein